jgi:hypothetical protein
MKKLCVAVFLSLGLLIPAGTMASDSLVGDLEYLGYSSEIRDFARDKLTAVRIPAQPSPRIPEKTHQELLQEEATAVQEQLTELAHTRSLTANSPINTQEAKEKLDSYWATMKPQAPLVRDELDPALKNEIRERIHQALQTAGYDVKQLELVDLPNAPQVRAIVRVVKPLTTRNTYKEIQQNLYDAKRVSLEAATIDGVPYLSELTTFVAENPKNRYYYEKTILNP